MFSRHDCKCKHCNPVPMRAAGGFRTKADRFLLTFPAWHVCVGLCVQDLVSAVLAIEILRLKSCAARHAMLECEQALRWRYHACIYSGSVNKTLGMQQQSRDVASDPILSCGTSVCYFLASVRAFPLATVLAAESHCHYQSSAASFLSLASKISPAERHLKHPSHIDPVRTHAQESTVPHIQKNPRSMASLQSLTGDRLRSSLRPHAGALSFAEAQERSSNVLRQHGLGSFHTRCCRDAKVHADHNLLSVKQLYAK